jgi:hypothetical protein
VSTILSILLISVASGASAQSPSAVFAPESFRESVTPESLKAMGFDPANSEVTIPLHPGFTITQKTVTAGGEGFLSVGMAEHYTTDLTYAFSSKGSLHFVRDAASARTPYESQSSSALTINLDQGFGGGSWAGKMSLVHESTSNSATADGHSESSRDALNLTMGLGKSSSLTAGASFAKALNQTDTHTEQQDLVITSLQTAVAEFHHSSVSTNGVPVETTQIALRTPTVALADLGSFSASGVHNESSVAGKDTTYALNLSTTVAQLQVAANFMTADRPAGPETVRTVTLSAKPTDKVDLSASLFDASRPTGDESVHTVGVVARPMDALTISATQTSTVKPGLPDTTATVVTLNLKVSDAVAVAANLNSTNTEGAGTTTVTSVDVASTPTDGTGLGIKAGVINTDTPLAEVEPTVHVQVDYTTKDALAVSGSYHQAAGLVAPEVLSSLALPLLGGKLSAHYGQQTTTAGVIPFQGFGAQYVRPVGWGLTGTVGYDTVTNLVGLPLTSWGVKAGISGENHLLGKIDLQYSGGKARNPIGSVSSTTGITLSLARPIHGDGTLSLSVKHTRLQFFPTDDQIRLDATVSF